MTRPPGTEISATSSPVLSPPTLCVLLAGETCGQKREVGSDERAGEECCRDRKGLKINLFYLKVLNRWVAIGVRIKVASGVLLCPHECTQSLDPVSGAPQGVLPAAITKNSADAVP